MTTLVKKLNGLSNISSVEKKELKLSKVFDFKTKPIFNIIIGSLILVILFCYLLEMNQLVVLGFRVDELERQREELEKTNKNLEMEKMKLESLSGSSNEVANLNFIKVEKIDYLRPMAGLALTKK